MSSIVFSRFNTKQVVSYSCNQAMVFLAGGALAGKLISVLKFTSRELNPLATSVGFATFCLADNFFHYIHSQLRPKAQETKLVTGLIDSGTTALAAALGFAAYTTVSTWSYQVTIFANTTVALTLFAGILWNK